MSSYDGAKTRVKVGSAYSWEFKVEVGVHQGSVLLPILFAILQLWTLLLKSQKRCG